MRFYSIDYLQTQSSINDYLKYIVIFSTLFILIVVFSLYMRHRLQTKYRDLTIIAFLFSSSVQLSDGIIVKVNDLFYRVNLSPDQKTYNLVEVSLVNPEIEIIKN